MADCAPLQMASFFQTLPVTIGSLHHTPACSGQLLSEDVAGAGLQSSGMQGGVIASHICCVQEFERLAAEVVALPANGAWRVQPAGRAERAEELSVTVQRMLLELIVVLWALDSYDADEGSVTSLDRVLAPHNLSIYRNPASGLKQHDQEEEDPMPRGQKRKCHKHRHKGKKRKYAWLDDEDVHSSVTGASSYKLLTSSGHCVASGSLLNIGEDLAAKLVCNWVSSLCRS